LIVPLLRGLFGLSWDAQNRTLGLDPHLPADWNRARVRNVHVGSITIDLDFERRGGQLVVRANTSRPESLCLVGRAAPATPCKAVVSAVHTFAVALKPVELAIPASLPQQGSTAAQLKVLDEAFSRRQATFSFEAPGGSRYDLPIRLNRPNIAVQGARMAGDKLHIEFPEGTGYQRKTVNFNW